MTEMINCPNNQLTECVILNFLAALFKDIWLLSPPVYMTLGHYFSNRCRMHKHDENIWGKLNGSTLCSKSCVLPVHICHHRASWWSQTTPRLWPCSNSNSNPHHWMQHDKSTNGKEAKKLAFSNKLWLDFICQLIWEQLPSEAARKLQLPSDLHSSAGRQTLPALWQELSGPG